ncbi:MAG: hypothetical protein DRR16_06140 [Candidatus Parabeggiatoa sp. nov. 3]|nr:MAG: hypothetical protein DRR00_02345 [Gammaproteobacteria bacterium]RKZ69265.1 MAG: hypothetical protein DRQ99_01310 [Gammaproteobacteria bacterium]RKZ87913.1 MAG: hypothetical protein DRR16_06140 [Gammaproteobacteria bacterium]
MSENEQGLIKRRLLENRELFTNVLQLLLQWGEQANKTIDIGASLKKLEEDEKKEVRSFDAIAKVLSKEFPELLRFILDEYQVDATQSKTLIGKEFIMIKRIADVLFEAKDKNGNDVIIHLEFERQYESDGKMDKRKLEYRHLMEMDDELEGKTILCNVFYLKGSPQNKQAIEERHIKLPTADPRYSGELKYKAYHVSLMTVDMILQRNLPFLLPFIVKSELQAEVSSPKTPTHVFSIRQQIDDNEAGLTSMIERLTADQLEILRLSVEYLWARSYSKEVFNKSTLLKLMREQLDLRQDDIQWGRNEAKAVAKQMRQEGELTQEQMEKFLKRMERLNQSQKKKE